MSVNGLISSGTPNKILFKSTHVVQNVCMHTHMEIYCMFVQLQVVRQHAMQGLREGRGAALHILDPDARTGWGRGQRQAPAALPPIKRQRFKFYRRLGWFG
jgi:hypothetical protein